MIEKIKSIQAKKCCEYIEELYQQIVDRKFNPEKEELDVPDLLTEHKNIEEQLLQMFDDKLFNLCTKQELLEKRKSLTERFDQSLENLLIQNYEKSKKSSEARLSSVFEKFNQLPGDLESASLSTVILDKQRSLQEMLAEYFK